MIGHIKLRTLFKIWLLSIWDTRAEFLKKSYWVTDFPDYYDAKCFDCNLRSCEGCEYYF